MNLYKTPPQQSFLNLVADFILSKFNKTNIHQLKVILPNGLACKNLKEILIQKQDIAILPNIIPFANIAAEGKEAFKISAKDLDVISPFEEKAILTEIIYNYPKLKFSIMQSVQFSSHIAKLFYLFIRNNISTEVIANIIPSSVTEHIYSLLTYIYQEWQNRLKKLQKVNLANYQINMLYAEINRLNQLDTKLIVAGIIGEDQITWNFLKNVASSNAGSIILPPIGNFSESLFSNNKSIDNGILYCFAQLLRTLDKKFSDFQCLGEEQYKATILDRLIAQDAISLGHCEALTEAIQESVKKTDKSTSWIASMHAVPSNDAKPNHIDSLEFENIFEEAEVVSRICKNRPDQNIAIIINNPANKEFYCNSLIKHALSFQDLLGSRVLDTHICQLLIATGNLLYSEFTLTKLFILLKNPLVNSSYVMKLELLLLGKNRFIPNLDNMLEIVKKSADQKLIEYCIQLIAILNLTENSNKFNNMLKYCIKTAEKLCKDLWQKPPANHVSELLAKLVKLNWNLILKKREYFSEILINLISDTQYPVANAEAKITLSKPEDSALLKFDLIIIVDFNIDAWPPLPFTTPFFSYHMQEQLGLILPQIQSGIYLYYFYLLLHNKNVIITRSKKQGSKSISLPSNYMLRLESLLKIYNVESLCHPELKQRISFTAPSLKGDPSPAVQYDTIIHSPIFPSSLSVTDIETLIRNPYSFYAKKILQLRDKDMIGEEPKISEFGNFIHAVLERYTKAVCHSRAGGNAENTLLNIGTDILSTLTLPPYTRKIWQTKLLPIATAFIEFDEERQKSALHVYVELKGEMLLNIAGQEITITGIADRIEIDDLGHATIIDYKTGSVPTKQDVESGLSPQLIINALIMRAGGFGVKAICIDKVIYVKISSSEPYIQTTEIEVNDTYLSRHKEGLLSLLEYYVINKEFDKNIDLLKYNAYSHLARKSSGGVIKEI